MVTETEDDAEGALLEALRGVVGPDVPIVTTLDLHANATVRMARNANALVSYRTYPHIDGYERAVQAAALVQAAMEGKKKPRCLLVQPAMLEGAEHGRTTQPGLMLDLLAKADSVREGAGHQRRQHPGGLHLGRHSLHRPLDRGEPRARRPRRAPRRSRAELIDEIWRRREEGGEADYRPIADGIAAAKARASARRARWSSPTAPTIRAAAATTTPRRCCRR